MLLALWLSRRCSLGGVGTGTLRVGDCDWLDDLLTAAVVGRRLLALSRVVLLSAVTNHHIEPFRLIGTRSWPEEKGAGDPCVSVLTFDQFFTFWGLL